jgi:hypothetical protein
LTYLGTGGEDRRGEQILKLAGDIYRIEAKLILESNFQKISNRAEIYEFDYFSVI